MITRHFWSDTRITPASDISPSAKSRIMALLVLYLSQQRCRYTCAAAKTLTPLSLVERGLSFVQLLEIWLPRETHYPQTRYALT